MLTGSAFHCAVGGADAEEADAVCLPGPGQSTRRERLRTSTEQKNSGKIQCVSYGCLDERAVIELQAMRPPLLVRCFSLAPQPFQLFEHREPYLLSELSNHASLRARLRRAARWDRGSEPAPDVVPGSAGSGFPAGGRGGGRRSPRAESAVDTRLPFERPRDENHRSLPSWFDSPPDRRGVFRDGRGPPELLHAYGRGERARRCQIERTARASRRSVRSVRGTCILAPDR